MVRFIETKGYNFIIDSNALFCTTEFYERVALYFGDVDENGVPIFITERDHPDYQNPFKLPMIADRPGYNSEIERVRGDVVNASRADRCPSSEAPSRRELSAKPTEGVFLHSEAQSF
jgi:hypothetical protein